MRRHLGEPATVLVAALLAAMVLVGSDTAVGQEKHKVSWSVKAENTKFTFRHTLDIPDMPYHRIAMNEIRRTWPDGGGPVVEGRKVVEEINWDMADGIGGNGGGHGYSVWRFENGDQSFAEYHVTFQSVVTPIRKLTYVATSVTTGGTGALKGIKGIWRVSGVIEYNAEGTTPVRVEHNGEGEYWFEK